MKLIIALIISLAIIGCGANDGVSLFDSASNNPPPANNTASVIYDGNGATAGTVPVDATSYQVNDSVTVMGNTGTLSKTGFSFSGWDTTANGGGSFYSPNSIFSFVSDMTLYAKWTAPDEPLGDDERPMGKLQSFVQVVNRLPYPVGSATSLQIGNKIYVFGGVKSDADGQTNPVTTTNVLEATIDSAGNIGTFSISSFQLQTARRAMRAVRVGSWVYLIGGYSFNSTNDTPASGTRYKTVERAPIQNEELAGNFQTVSSTLVNDRTNYALVKTSSYVYIIGGNTHWDSVERAPISGGEISGNFELLTRTVKNSTTVENGMVVPRYTHTVTVIGDTAYILGGAQGSNHASLNSIEEVQIKSDGTLGDFKLMSQTLGVGRNRVISAGLNDDIYVFAGWDAGFLTSVYSTSLVGGKITTNFSNSGATLAVGVENGVSLLTRSAVYYMGGFAASRLYDYVQRGAITNP